LGRFASVFSLITKSQPLGISSICLLVSLFFLFVWFFFGSGSKISPDCLLCLTSLNTGVSFVLDCGSVSYRPIYTDRKIKSGGLWQVHGAYVQGIGYYLSEEYQIDAANGKVCHTDPNTYFLNWHCSFIRNKSDHCVFQRYGFYRHQDVVVNKLELVASISILLSCVDARELEILMTLEMKSFWFLLLR
jgi:hypothetical protein